MNIEFVILIALLALALGFFIGVLLTNKRGQAMVRDAEARIQEAHQAEAEARNAEAEARKAESFARAEAAESKALLQSEKSHALEAMKMQAQELRAEFKAMTAEMIQAQSQGLRAEHLNSLQGLLQPLGKDIESFREQFLKGHASLGEHMKILASRTDTLGKEAEDLAKALKGNPKLQGNWGEAVLENILVASGLTEGRDFELQARTKDDEGRNLIPDVVVHLPAGRAVVIDSKVSLKAYTAYVATESEEERAQMLKEHLKSVREHVKELAAKNYDKLVEGNIGYVLMFIPGEGAYMAAVTSDPLLATESYGKHVILINPTNLLMALQLAYNLWQSELQSRNVSEIYKTAEQLYKKFTQFARNFVKIGNSLNQLQNTYDEAQKQLSTGRGNIVGRLENWKKKGMISSADIPMELKEESEVE